jgi:hypothetical protein
MEGGGQSATYSSGLARATTATVLIVAAIAALAITSLVQSHRRATAGARPMSEPPAALAVPSPASGAFKDIGPFAFGHLEFDWNPTEPDGVPGFDSWPPGSRRR